MYNRSVIKEKIREAMASVLPITAIVAVLCFALVPMESGLMLSFLLGAAMLVLGRRTSVSALAPSVFTPDSELRACYEQAYHKYCRLLQALLAIS